MVNPKTKYLLYLLLSCAAYPTIVYILIPTVYKELIGGVLHTKKSTYYVSTDFWYYLVAVLTQIVGIAFFTIGAYVVWSDLLKGRREALESKFSVINLFRSIYMIERTWFVLPFSLILITGIHIYDYTKN